MPLCVAHTTQRQKVVEKVRFFWIVKPIVGNDMMNVEFVPERLLGRSAVPTLVRVSLSRKPPLSFPVAAPIIKRVAALPGGRCFAGQVLCPPFPITDMRAEGAILGFDVISQPLKVFPTLGASKSQEIGGIGLLDRRLCVAVNFTVSLKTSSGTELMLSLEPMS